MYKIIEKSDLGIDTHRFVIEAADIAKKARAGQFVILRLDEQGERFPITIADWDAGLGALTLFVQSVGKSTLQMGRMKAGDVILDVVGPLGVPSRIGPAQSLVAIGGGLGIAAIYSIVRDHSEHGNKSISILGARSKGQIILEQEMRSVSSEVRVCTEDGSWGHQGLVTDVLEKMIREGEHIDCVLAIGPLMMMRAVAELTRPHGIKTLVSLNPIMMDGTGMCGACRVRVGNENKFACVDGPEFDGHLVDFDGLLNRLKIYKTEEKQALEQYKKKLLSDCPLESRN